MREFRIRTCSQGGWPPGRAPGQLRPRCRWRTPLPSIRVCGREVESGRVMACPTAVTLASVPEAPSSTLISSRLQQTERPAPVELDGLVDASHDSGSLGEDDTDPCGSSRPLASSASRAAGCCCLDTHGRVTTVRSLARTAAGRRSTSPRTRPCTSPPSASAAPRGGGRQCRTRCKLGPALNWPNA